MADLTGGTCSSGDDASYGGASGDEFEPVCVATRKEEEEDSSSSSSSSSPNKRKRSDNSDQQRYSGTATEQDDDDVQQKKQQLINKPSSSSSSSLSSSQPTRTTVKIPTTKSSISITSPASKICEAFFICMDFDGNGYIDESESKFLSVIAFDRSEIEADQQWLAMLDEMDSNHDSRISKEEYVKWWTQKHAQTHIKSDGSFEEEYGLYLLSCLQKISAVKAANKMCDMFFDALDSNKDGYLVESEVKNVSKWAFGESIDEANERWKDMLTKMDTNGDKRISKEEYRSYWLSKAKNKINPDGTFVDGYKRYLLKILVKIKNGNRRQEQIKKWEESQQEDDDYKKNKNNNKNKNIRTSIRKVAFQDEKQQQQQQQQPHETAKIPTPTTTPQVTTTTTTTVGVDN